MARACLVQFDDVEPIEHIWSLVRTKAQIDRVLSGIEANPGVVLYTLVDDDAARSALEEGCRRLDVPCIPVLDPVIGALATLSRRGRAAACPASSTCSTTNISTASTR